MAKSLIIVESPGKVPSLKSFLGPDFEVLASVGHVRDLPEHGMGVDVEHDFAPTYRTLPERRDILKRIAVAASHASTVYLASDPDREGEAIAWHLKEALQLKSPTRIQFNEITRTAVRAAIDHPRTLDMHLVDAQQARRILDRLVGYRLSPLLRAKIQNRLSGGRVQSVVVRMVVDREREIAAFKPEEYWTLAGMFAPRPEQGGIEFRAMLYGRGGRKHVPATAAEARSVLLEIDPGYEARLAAAPDTDAVGPDGAPLERLLIDYTAAGATDGPSGRALDVRRKEKRRRPAPPFITSTLQQEAARKLGFQARRTMKVAQSLYEGLDLGDQGHVGLITYMRSDSVRVSTEAQAEARAFIEERYGRAYVPEKPPVYATKGAAQDAHEAIRPTAAHRDPESVRAHLDNDEYRLYTLIHQRFVASQMNPAILDETVVDIAALPAGRPEPSDPWVFRATGSIIRFDGHLRVYSEGRDVEPKPEEEEGPLPALEAGQMLDLRSLLGRQCFTEPPRRYTEATLVKAMEEQGIGRPSTFATTLGTIQDREYVELRDKKFYPTELGNIVTDRLIEFFPQVMDIQFTAGLEKLLDEVEEGKADWVSLLRDFYGPFSADVDKAFDGMERTRPEPQPSEYVCQKTGAVMMWRESKMGRFLGCSNFPKCRKILKLGDDGLPVEGANFTCGMDEAAAKAALDPRTLPNATEHVCPAGNGGVMLRRTSARGPFLGCSKFPNCRTTLKIAEDGSLLPGQEFTCTFGKTAARTGGRRTGATRKGATRRRSA